MQATLQAMSPAAQIRSWSLESSPAASGEVRVPSVVASGPLSVVIPAFLC